VSAESIIAGIRVRSWSDQDGVQLDGRHFLCQITGMTHDEVHRVVGHIAAAVAERCAQECDRLANGYGSEKRDFAEAIRALFPKP
jgi:hypothetical protein